MAIVLLNASRTDFLSFHGEQACPRANRKQRGGGVIREARLSLGGVAAKHMLEEGVISRNMGDAVAFCPPMIINEGQVDDLMDRVERVLDKTAAEVGV